MQLATQHKTVGIYKQNGNHAVLLQFTVNKAHCIVAVSLLETPQFVNDSGNLSLTSVTEMFLSGFC